MALKKVKTDVTGSSRWFKRAEVKKAAKKLRRSEGKKACDE